MHKFKNASYQSEARTDQPIPGPFPTLPNDKKGKALGTRLVNMMFVILLLARWITTPTGRLKKYEPLDSRDFVPFSDIESC